MGQHPVRQGGVPIAYLVKTDRRDTLGPAVLPGRPAHQPRDVLHIDPASWYGTLLKGVFNFQPDPTVLQVTVWLLYLIPTLTRFLAPVGFASGKGKVKGPDEQGTRPSKAPQA